MPEPSDDGEEREEFSDLYGEDIDSDTRVAAIIDRVKTHILEKPFPQPMVEAIREKIGVKLDELSLMNREINVIEAICGDGHIHREIVLVETFNKAAAEAASPDLTLNIAMDRIKTLAVSVPPTALGRHQEDQCKTVMGFGKDGSVKRAFAVSQVFETEASITGYKAGLAPGIRASVALRRARGDSGPSFGGLN
jgi:hypothetical protein